MSAGDWFQQVWPLLSRVEQQAVRDKAQWEHASLRAVLLDWPTLAPAELRGLIPAPERQP